ncbi:MAG TPA: GNAT family N-acetyltransferase [Gaiellales bacterium]|nr:GNAT family N-acetyltransferase [Gaiellales bacterium]
MTGEPTVSAQTTAGKGSGLTVGTLRRIEDLEAIGGDWDAMVRAMPRPSPFMLHAWLAEWWRFHGHGDLTVHVAWRGGELVGGLPFHVKRSYGLRLVEFVGGHDSALADILLADPGDAAAAGAIARHAVASPHDAADVFGLPVDSQLRRQLGHTGLHVIERVEAPVLDISAGWDTVYRGKTTSKKRNLHRRRRRQLGEIGELSVEVARTPEELVAALEDAFRLHELRWEGRPDGSGFASTVGRRFYRSALSRMAGDDIPRILTLKVGGQAVAFHLYFAFCGRMYVHRLAFDPSVGRFSPGVVSTLDAIEAAESEGLKVVEFLGGDERYKVELADRFEPLHQGLGLARTPQGYAYVASRMASIRTRRRLKRSERIHRFYFEGLAPVRRAVERARESVR